LCPNGENAEDAGYMSLYLYSTNAEKTTFKVNFLFGLKNHKDQKIQYLRDVIKCNAQEFADESGYGFPKFLSHAKLFDASKNYVVDGELTIACKVG